MKNFILISFLLLSSFVYSQNSEKDFVKFDYNKDFTFNSGSDSLQPFFISEKPITNKEYIIYLYWLQMVYYEYPSILLMAFPEYQNITLPNYEYYNLDTLVVKSEGWVKNYIFNPEYIDYPIIGISYEQAVNFTKWLTDRYNEYKMIDLNFLLYDYSQFNENCFVTESFLAEQYVGFQKKIFEFNDEKYTFWEFVWNNNILSPSFRLPTQSEIDLCSQIIEIKPYKMFFFLKIWEKQTMLKKNLFIYNFTVSEEYIETRDYKANAMYKNLNFQKVQLESKYSEFFIDEYLKNKTKNLIEIFKKLNYSVVDYNQIKNIEKDSLGQMPYFVLSENSKGETLILKKNKNNKENQISENNQIFRVAVCAIKK